MTRRKGTSARRTGRARLLGAFALGNAAAGSAIAANEACAPASPPQCQIADLNVGAGSYTVAATPSAQTTAVTNALTLFPGGTLQIAPAGTLILPAASAPTGVNWTGGTLADYGTVQGTGPLTVPSGGTLQGSGTLSLPGQTLTLAPGSALTAIDANGAPATLTIQAESLVVATGATLNVILTPAAPPPGASQVALDIPDTPQSFIDLSHLNVTVTPAGTGYPLLRAYTIVDGNLRSPQLILPTTPVTVTTPGFLAALSSGPAHFSRNEVDLVLTYTGAGAIAAGGTYLTAGLGGAVVPAFQGGKLLVWSPGTYTQNFTLDRSATNTLDQNGLASTFSGVFSDATTAGRLVVANAAAGGAFTPTAKNPYTNPGTGAYDPSTGSVTLTGVNTYTGTTEINPGALLQLAGDGSIALSSGIAVNGSLDISATSHGASVNALSGTGTVALGAQTLTLAGAASTFDGTIAGTGNIVVASQGLTLTARSTYTGTTTINPGATLTLTAPGAYTGTTLVNPGAVLVLSGAGSIATSSAVMANGTLDIGNTRQGATANALTGTGTIALGGQTLTLAGRPSTFGGTIAGTGNVVFASQGLTLTTPAAYTGTTVVNPGATLVLSGAGSIAASSAVMANGTIDISGTTNGATFNTFNGFADPTANDPLPRQPTILLGTKTLTLAGPMAQGGQFYGTIAGAGNLVVNGSGLSLAGTNTYTGTTTVNAGKTLYLYGNGSIASLAGVIVNGRLDIQLTYNGATVNALSGSGTVTPGAQTLTLAGPPSNFGGTIDGFGKFAFPSIANPGTAGFANSLADIAILVVASGSTATLGGTATYVGATAIRAGATLNLSGTGSIAASEIVSAAGTLDISGTTEGATIQAVTGAGTIALGARTLTLAGSYLYTGTIAGSGNLTIASQTPAFGTVIAPGVYTTSARRLSFAAVTLTTPATYTGTTTINPGATLVLAGAGSIAASSAVTDNGTLDISGTDSGATINALTGTGTVALGTKTLTLYGSSTFSGTFTGTGSVSFAGGGGQSFTGTTTLTGPLRLIGTTLNQSGTLTAPSVAVGTGTLYQNGTLNADSLSVASGGTLKGSGTVNAPTTVAGRLAPGNSPGTLTFTAPVTLAPTATLSLDIDGTGTGTGAGNYSRIIVQGASFTAAGAIAPVLRGITGSATNTYTPPLGAAFTVVTATAGVNGAFASLTQPSAGLPAGATFNALATANAVTLYVTPAAYAAAGTTPNQAAAGRAIDSLQGRTDAAATTLLDPVYRLAAAQIPGTLDQLAASIYGDLLLDGIARNRDFAATITAQGKAARGFARPDGATSQTAAETTVWATATGRQTRIATQGYGWTSVLGGAAAGAEKSIGPLTLGFAAGGSAGTLTAGSQRADTQSVNLGAYAGWRQGMWFAAAQAAVSGTDDVVTRTITLTGLRARGHAKGAGAGAGIEAGLDLTAGPARIEPFAALRIDTLRHGAYAETGSATFNETIAAASATQLRSTIGVRTETTVDLAGTPATPFLSLAWAHELADTTATTTAALSAGGAPLVLSSRSGGRDAAVIATGATIPLAPGLSLRTAYGAEIRRDANAQSLTAGLRWTW